MTTLSSQIATPLCGEGRKCQPATSTLRLPDNCLCCSWDVRKFFAEHLTKGIDCLLPTDDWDFINSGQMFFKNTENSIRLLKRWYEEAPRYYSAVSSGQELAAFEHKQQKAKPGKLGKWLSRFQIARNNLQTWHRLNRTETFTPGKGVPQFNGGVPAARRCHAAGHSVHEQGCFKSIFDNHPLLSSVAIMDADYMCECNRCNRPGLGE